MPRISRAGTVTAMSAPRVRGATAAAGSGRDPDDERAGRPGPTRTQVSCWAAGLRYGLSQAAGLHGSTVPAFMPARASSIFFCRSGVIMLLRSWKSDTPTPTGSELASKVWLPPLSVPLATLLIALATASARCFNSVAKGTDKGGNQTFDASSDPVGVGVSDFHDLKSMMTPDLQKKIDDALAGMKAGTVDPCKPAACDKP